MSFTENLKSCFNQVSDALLNELKEGENANINLHGEESLFVRFNGNKVRQNTQIEQRSISLLLQKNQRTASISFSISGNVEEDLKRASFWLNEARQECALLPEDPYQVALVNNGNSDIALKGKLLSDSDVVAAITGPAQGSDLAGIYSGGPLVAANKNSKGQSHWFSNENFSFDYSLYLGEKAVKGVYAGTEWNQERFKTSLAESRNKLALLDRPRKTLKPGAYRTYLAPAAVAEIATMFSWGAFSYNAFRQGSSALQKAVNKEENFSPLLNIQENFALGLTHPFNSLGELAPAKTDLVLNGELKNLMISTRSAKEYGVQGNNADNSEGPRSLEILPGSLEEQNILKELGTGLYLSNLHYINWSDRMGARITGMTRYACFWVENGEIQAPIADMRFDESLYDCLGKNLVAITKQQEVEPNVGTYEARGFGGMKVPGLLINDFKFTL
ncbi:TldD/PmbA family protein [Bdellovibrio sp. HCB2-146]|uniref:TldD/PmbA family protein n=1 Tax=Bdellovibrio sp. HCB2-146 TaxID=3394362 RepID=UPI0039BC385C